MSSATRARRVLFLALITGIVFLPIPIAHAQTSPVDLITNQDFEDAEAPLGFDAVSSLEGSVAHTTTNPIDGTGSLKVTVNSYGRVLHWSMYGYGSGPFAGSVTFSAKLRVDSTTEPDRELTACAIAYFMDSQEPSSFCRNFPVDPDHVVDVHLSLDTNNRQLNYLFPQFSLNDSGTIEATVDDAHYLVEEAQLPPVPSGFERVDRLTNNGFEDASTPLAFDAASSFDGAVAHTTEDPIIGEGSLKISLNSYGRVGAFLPYGYGSGPFARSVTLTAKLRVDSTTVPGRQVTACAIAYFLDSQEPSSVCQNFPVDPASVANVYLSLDTQDRQLNYIIPQFSLNDSGTMEATVDSVHYYVVQPVP